MLEYYNYIKWHKVLSYYKSCIDTNYLIKKSRNLQLKVQHRTSHMFTHNEAVYRHCGTQLEWVGPT